MTQPVPTGRANARLSQTVGDMVRSMAVVLGAVAVILIITLRPQPDPIRVVDYAPTLSVARAQAGYPVLAPQGLGPQWRATSARWEPTPASDPDPAWHLGVVTPTEEYVQLGQSATTDADYLPEQTDRGRPTGSVQVGGVAWERYESTDREGVERRSLVRIVGGVTTVVSGGAAWPEIEQFAGSLKP